MMTRSPTRAPFLLIGATAVLAWTVSNVSAGEDIAASANPHATAAHGANACASFGPGFVDVGNGLCQRVSARIRVYVNPRNSAMNPPLDTWPTGAASNAAMQSSNMVSGAEVTHLRVHGGLDGYSPFP